MLDLTFGAILKQKEANRKEATEIRAYNFSLVQYSDRSLRIFSGDMRDLKRDPQGNLFQFVDGFHNVASAELIKKNLENSPCRIC